MSYARLIRAARAIQVAELDVIDALRDYGATALPPHRWARCRALLDEKERLINARYLLLRGTLEKLSSLRVDGS